MAVGNWPKGIVEDRYDFLAEGYAEVRGMIETLFEIKEPTEGAYDQRTTFIGLGVLTQKASENTSVTYRRPSEGFTAYTVYRDFDDALSLTKNEVDDFPTSKVRDLAQETIQSWGRGLRLTEERHAAVLFKRGGFTGGDDNFKAVLPGTGLSQQADGLAYDAKPFFTRNGNERTNKNGSTYSNARALTLNNVNYETLYELAFVTNAYDERDEEIDLSAMGQVVLLIPPQLRAEAVQAVESEYLPGSNYNDKNPWFNTSKLVQWDLLRGNATAWYLGVAKQGIRFYRRGRPEIRMFRNEDSGEYRATIRARYSFLPWNFRFWVASNSPTS